MRFIVKCKSFNGVPRGGEVELDELEASRHVALDRLELAANTTCVQDKGDNVSNSDDDESE